MREKRIQPASVSIYATLLARYLSHRKCETGTLSTTLSCPLACFYSSDFQLNRVVLTFSLLFISPFFFCCCCSCVQVSISVSRLANRIKTHLSDVAGRRGGSRDRVSIRVTSRGTPHRSDSKKKMIPRIGTSRRNTEKERERERKREEEKEGKGRERERERDLLLNHTVLMNQLFDKFLFGSFRHPSSFFHPPLNGICCQSREEGEGKRGGVEVGGGRKRD